jgi:peptidyl-prolyl cis-trans isomerase SurA
LSDNPRFGVKSGTVLIVVILFVFAFVFVTGCSKSQAGPDVMATVNGRKIQRADVDRFYNEQTKASQAQQASDEQSDSLRLNILRELIDNEILRQRAEKLGLLATDDEVQQKLNELKSAYTQEEFDKRVKDSGRTLADLKDDIRRSLTVDKVVNKEITSKIDIKDSDITSFYNEHKADFNLIEPQYQLAQILVTVQPGQVRNLKNDKAQNDAEAKKKIQQLLNRLDSGEDFATVAMNYSEDPDTAANGGLLGVVPESGLKNTDPTTRDAVMKLKPGQYTQIITVGPQGHVLGYRIVEVVAKEPAGQRELSDPRVQQHIRDQLRERREQLLKAAYYTVLRDQAKVENFYAEQVLKASTK